MKHFMWAIILLGFAPSATAQDKGYTLDTAPWSNQNYEVCQTPNDKGLRAVIFEPEIETWSYTEDGPPITDLKATKDGIIEVVVSNQKQRPAYYLRSQKIGYLDDKNTWVDENGQNILSLGSFKTVKGEKSEPSLIGSYEKLIYKANIDREHAAALEKIHYEPPCTVFSIWFLDEYEAEIRYEFDQNNPYQCDTDAGLKRSQKFNYVDKVSRPVVSMPDGTSYYIKYPDGEIKTYGWTGFERLYKEDKSFICDWNDLGRFIGFELIHDNE